MSLIKQRLFYSGKFGDGLLQGDGIFAVSTLETVSAALPTMPTRGLAGKEHRAPVSTCTCKDKAWWSSSTHPEKLLARRLSALGVQYYQPGSLERDPNAQTSPV